ncbi:MAG TPA: beta-N-acetylhexosaminidase [Candidatus Limnocylindria bacterium]|nr:beta-N-acetylhexosaminidase [Candidatus Limnocylindria bacterium]
MGRYPIIPWPRAIDARDGAFALGAGLQIALVDGGNSDVRRLGDLLARYLRELAGINAEIGDGGAIRMGLRSDAPAGTESHALDITPERIELTARDPRGLFYGIQTLRQLIAASPKAVPAVRIEDAPRFPYRGLHLDVGRHFFPVEFIKRYIDLLATFKLNTFHWHLTEDQGWRLEIKRYPKLTEVGAWRKETIVGHARRGPTGYDGARHGGFYTQDQAREVVAYAKERGVTVLPEIEMPGHSLAALAAYPEYANVPGPFEVRTTWGISDEVFSPSEATFRFLENVLREVMDIFPSEYIHIGGDEAPKKRWKESPEAQAIIKKEKLADEDELQSWFIRRIERFLNANGRRLVGWDEILEGGLAPNATVMSWRGTKGGIAAAKQGHDVVMAPQEDLYFDHYQADPEHEPLAIGGMTPIEDTYRYEPIAAELTADEATHVLGPQACMWTEYMPTTDQVEYMAYPRVLALAEIAWSPREARDWDSFQKRLPAALRFLDHLDVKYRKPS